jgi:hypothetical protein
MSRLPGDRNGRSGMLNQSKTAELELYRSRVPGIVGHLLSLNFNLLANRLVTGSWSRRISSPWRQVVPASLFYASKPENFQH